MRGGRLVFDVADQRYTNTRLSLIVAARGQEDDDRVFVAQASIGQGNAQLMNEVLVRKLEGAGVQR
jgi:thermostable 8-oxoguanine DNA glycosylase